jgi:hypothetical protein
VITFYVCIAEVNLQDWTAKMVSKDQYFNAFREAVSDSHQKGLWTFWSQFDEAAKGAIATEIGFYVGYNAEKETRAINDRLAQNRLISRELKSQIKLLKKALGSTALFESLIVANPDPIPGGRRPFEPIGRPAFSSVLRDEIKRLSTLLRGFERQSTMKRFGVSRKHYWLLFAQEFALAWGRGRLQKTLDLNAVHLASLIDCARDVIGDTESEATDPQKIAKAIYLFRKNPHNQVFVSLIPRMIERLMCPSANQSITYGCKILATR